MAGERVHQSTAGAITTDLKAERLLSGAGSTSNPERLLRIAGLASRTGSDQIVSEARAAALKLEQGRFYVACLGQFKRGKSTLVNALVGEEILPNAVTPVTSIPTILRFGEKRAGRVRFKNENAIEIACDRLADYVSEAGNPENVKQVSVVDVYIPCPLLRGGMCLVDTPGIASVFAENTATTHSFLPQIDAAILVLGADPPISADELALLRKAKELPHLLFVLNKSDRISAEERASALNFTRQVLIERLGLRVDSIFEVSALEIIQHCQSQRDWPLLIESLRQLEERSGTQIVHEAAQRSFIRLSRRLLAVVEEQRNALVRPLEVRLDRIRKLQEVVAQAERALDDLGLLLTGDQQRLSRSFGERREEFLRAKRALAHEMLNAAIKPLPRGYGPRYRRNAMHAAQGIARELTLPWLESEGAHALQDYHRITKRFFDLANEFLSKYAGMKDGDSIALPEQLPNGGGFDAPSGFHFLDYIALAEPASPLRYAADLVLAAARGHAVIAADAHSFVDLLLETNTERVRNDLDRRVAESRKQLEKQIRRTLRGLTSTAEQALERGQSAAAMGVAGVTLGLDKLAAVESELDALANEEG